MYNQRRRASFSKAEDRQLKKLVEIHGDNWEIISKGMKGRNARQCKDRWVTYLSPNINKSDWTQEEDMLLLSKLNSHQSKWALLVNYFPGRTPTNIKNRASALKRKMIKYQRALQTIRTRAYIQSIYNQVKQTQAVVEEVKFTPDLSIEDDFELLDGFHQDQFLDENIFCEKF